MGSMGGELRRRVGDLGGAASGRVEEAHRAVPRKVGSLGKAAFRRVELVAQRKRGQPR